MENITYLFRIWRRICWN